MQGSTVSGHVNGRASHFFRDAQMLNNMPAYLNSLTDFNPMELKLASMNCPVRFSDIDQMSHIASWASVDDIDHFIGFEWKAPGVLLPKAQRFSLDGLHRSGWTVLSLQGLNGIPEYAEWVGTHGPQPCDLDYVAEIVRNWHRTWARN